MDHRFRHHRARQRHGARLQRPCLRGKRVWAQFGPPPTGSTEEEFLGQIKVAPDGACLDAEGALCVAPDFSEAARAAAREGSLVAFRVPVPAA